MSITKRILDNRHAVWASVIAAFVFGTLAYMGIPVRLFPDTAPPLVNVVTPWPGAAASDVAQDLSRILEEEFASIEGVVQLKASSQDNLSLISIEFQYGTDVALGAIDVQNAVSRVGQELPAGAELPRVMTFSTADRPVYTVGIAGLDLTEARRLAEDVVQPRLQQVSGVAAVDVFGGHTQGITVALDPALAETHRLPLPAVSQAILTANLSAPAGRLRGTRTETAMRVDQRSHRVDSLEALKIPLPDGTQLRLGDVATVTRGGQEDDAWFAIQGQ